MSNEQWGRVDADGTVWVNDGEWRSVGQFLDGDAAAALAFFERKFHDLDSQVLLLEQRARAGAAAKDLVHVAETLTAALVAPNVVGNIEALRTRVAVINSSLESVKAEQEEQNKAAAAESLARREAIVARTEELAAQSDDAIHWKKTGDEIAELFAQWQAEQKSSARVAKKAADELWSRFRTARQDFERRQRAFFATRHNAERDAKARKNDLIERAEALSERGAAALGDYRRLLDEWKTVPRMAKSVDDALWAKFKAAGDALHAAGSAEWAQNLEKKTALLAEYAWIEAEKDLAKALQGLRKLGEAWSSIGRLAREVERDINAKFSAIERAVRAREAEHLDKTNPEKIARAQGFAAQVEQAIEALEAELAAAQKANNTAAVDRVTKEIAAKREWLAALS
ncbi:uncharacterized protein DUF349 [Microbacteriaceae bacterium MWH-Ta3]|nr:uncharacterized protein DUF349 [Microbacteriaceae bacterium MWH-Ta3]